MSIFSDYKCGALSESDFRYECNKMNREARHEEEEYWLGAFASDEDEGEEDDEPDGDIY